MPRHKHMNRSDYRRRRHHYLSLRLRAQIQKMREADRANVEPEAEPPPSSMLEAQTQEYERAQDAAYAALREELKTYRREEDMAAMEREIINHQLVRSGCVLSEEQAVKRLPRLKYGDGL